MEHTQSPPRLPMEHPVDPVHEREPSSSAPRTTARTRVFTVMLDSGVELRGWNTWVDQQRIPALDRDEAQLVDLAAGQLEVCGGAASTLLGSILETVSSPLFATQM